MCLCFSVSSTHVLDANLANYEYKDKNDLLTQCIRFISTIASIVEVRRYLQFTCECIDGKKRIDDCDSDFEKKIYLLTGNENNSIFARQTVTRGATFLLFVLWVSSVILDSSIGTLIIPDDDFRLEHKYLFMKDLMNLSCFKDNKYIRDVSSQINRESH